LIVDDDERFRQGLRTLLQWFSSENFCSKIVVEEAALPEEALRATERYRPSLILLDLELPQSSGITVLNKLQDLPFQTKVLILSAHQDEQRVFEAMRMGAGGYVFKSRLSTHLSLAIATVLNGEVYLPPEVATRFFRFFQEQVRHSHVVQRQARLTEREYEVLCWLVKGASNDEIACHLYVTVATVKAHLTAIYEKLQVTSRTQAIVAALKMGLVDT
jgi:DNA-binding NarL/FixJ family response regulator